MERAYIQAPLSSMPASSNAQPAVWETAAACCLSLSVLSYIDIVSKVYLAIF